MVQSLYGVAEAEPALWVFLEHQDGRLAPVSQELLGKGRELADGAGWPLTGLLLGQALQDLASEAFTWGADRVVVAEHPHLAGFAVEAYARVVADILMTHQPSVLLFGATPDGRDLAGRLAVRLRTGLNADCTDLRLDGDRGVLVSEVSGFGGGVLALIEMVAHRPQMATVRPGVFPVGVQDRAREGQIITWAGEPDPADLRSQVLERHVGQRLDLTQAEILIAGGRGVDGEFGLLQELADLLGGDVGATRPPVDEGHVERERQIGQTGVVCRPRVAVVCGISGAFHFVVGIQEADLVIAINSDPEAPIFDYADYGIVGDVHQILPALIARLRAPQPAATVATAFD